MLILSKLIGLSVRDNKLSGPLPEELLQFMNFSSMNRFDISTNPLLSVILPMEACSIMDSGLIFDYSNILCGCDDCLCKNNYNNHTNNNNVTKQ